MTLRSDESAVSAVVGAVLLLALFSTAMTVYTVTTLPEWKADKEHNHQLAVEQSLGGLKSDLEALAARRDAGPVSANVPLEVSKVPLLQTVAARGTIGVEDGGFAAAFAFPSPDLYLGSDVAVATPSTTLAFCSGLCIASFDALTLGITMSTAYTASATVATATLTDSDGATLTATLAYVLAGGTCSGEVRLTVTDSSTGVSRATPLLCAGASLQLGNGGSSFRLDLLDDAYGASSSLARLTAPFSLTLAGGTGVTVGHALVYEDEGGVLRVTGTGTSPTTVLADLDGDRLVYSPQYQSFTNQDLIWEGGALLVDAGSTAQAITVDPSFVMAVDAASGRGSLDWTLVELQGEGSLGGAKDARVEVTFVAVEDVVFTAASGTITLTTDGAHGWYSFLRLAIVAAGATDSATVSEDTVAGTTTLTLSSTAGPVASDWVLRLRVIQAEVEVA